MTSSVRYEREISLCLNGISDPITIISCSGTKGTCLCRFKFKKLRDRNCNLTLERSCTIYTVPSRRTHTLTDEQRCTCLVSCINSPGFTLTELPCPAVTSPSPRAARVCTANTHIQLKISVIHTSPTEIYL